MITERIDNVTKIPPEFRRPDPPVPISCKIEITSKCNYRCGFCPLMTRTTVNHDMDFNLFKRITKEMKQIGIKEIGLFFIGESFVSSQLLIKCIKHCKKLGFEYVFLTSNASACNESSLTDVMMAGLDSLKWSVNIASETQFKEIVGVNPKLYSKALENIEKAWIIRELGKYKTKLYASSIRYDDEQLVKMKEVLDEKVIPYVDQHYWLPLYSMGSLATANEKEMGMQPIAGNPGRFDNPVDPIPCWTLFTEAHVMADGRMTGCCADATGEWVFGDLKKESFMSAWHNKDFQKLREEHLKGNVIGTKCEHCVIYK